MAQKNAEARPAEAWTKSTTECLQWKHNKPRTSYSANKFVMDRTGTYHFHIKVIHGQRWDSLFLEGGRWTRLTFVTEVEGLIRSDRGNRRNGERIYARR